MNNYDPIKDHELGHGRDPYGPQHQDAYHYHNVFEPIHYHLVLMVLPGVVPPPEVYEALQLADLTVEAHEDIILVGV